MKTMIFLTLLICHASYAAPIVFRTGDLIFHTSLSAQSKVIQKATGSPFSHVGIVEIADDGRAFVVEAISKVSRTEMNDWIERGSNGKFAVYRDPQLTAQDAKKFVESAKKFIGRRYDLFFTSHNTEIYCSELVDLSARANGLEWGRYQKFGSLNVRNPVVMGLARERWQRHPLCRGLKKFASCWFRIEEDLMITPVSLTEDSKLQQVYSNY